MLQSAHLAWALLLANPAPAQVPQVTVTLQAASRQQGLLCGDAVLEATSLGQSGAAPQSVAKAPAVLGKDVPLQLSPGPWELKLVAPGCWASPLKILIGTSPSRPQRMRVWPRVDAQGQLSLARGSELPSRLRIEFSSSFANPQAEEPSGEGQCEVASEGRFRCPLPATVLDIRLSAEGFAPHYLWAVDFAAPTAAKLGPVRLIAGASLSGWLLTDEGKPPKPEDTKLTLVPSGLADARSLSGELQRRFSTIEAKPRSNGFFQLGSLKAGSYLLTAGGAKYADTRLPITLVEGRESTLRDPVLLQAPLALAFALTPPVPPTGGNWRLALVRLHVSQTYAETVIDEQVPPDGWFEARGLSPGLHRLSVVSPEGDAVASREVRLGEEPSPILVEIGATRVEGRVTLGKKPLAATIWFGGQNGAEKVTAKSDEDGRFAASLPRLGAWRIDVSAEAPRVKKRLFGVDVPEAGSDGVSELLLALPDTWVKGVVRELDGGVPRSRTVVYVAGGRPETAASQSPDERGRFDFHGLDEGTLELYAWRDGARSKSQVVSLAKNQGREIELVLEPTLELHGVVVGPDGPIPGAFVQLQPAQDPLLLLPRAMADGAGRFEAHLPAHTREVLATVSAPSSTLNVARAPVIEGQELVLHLPRDGGTLTIERPVSGASAPGLAMAVVFREGVPFANGEDEHWAVLHRQSDFAAGLMVLPNLVAGSYEACHIRIEEYRAYVLGQRDPKRCVSGTLVPLGELTLRLPALNGS